MCNTIDLIETFRVRQPEPLPDKVAEFMTEASVPVGPGTGAVIVPLFLKKSMFRPSSKSAGSESKRTRRILSKIRFQNTLDRSFSGFEREPCTNPGKDRQNCRSLVPRRKGRRCLFPRRSTAVRKSDSYCNSTLGKRLREIPNLRGLGKLTRSRMGWPIATSADQELERRYRISPMKPHSEKPESNPSVVPQNSIGPRIKCFRFIDSFDGVRTYPPPFCANP